MSDEQTTADASVWTVVATKELERLRDVEMQAAICLCMASGHHSAWEFNPYEEIGGEDLWNRLKFLIHSSRLWIYCTKCNSKLGRPAEGEDAAVCKQCGGTIDLW